MTGRQPIGRKAALLRMTSPARYLDLTIIFLAQIEFFFLFCELFAGVTIERLLFTNSLFGRNTSLKKVKKYGIYIFQ